MKILLVNLPWKKGSLWGVRAGSRWPHIKSVQEKRYLPFPFFLAYAAALLRREGFQVELIDALAEELSVEDFLKRTLRAEPDLLLAETSTPSLENDLEILQRIPRDIRVALCGPEANIRKPEFLDENERIDYVLTGEYELTLLELVRRLEAGKDPAGVLGSIYRSGHHVRVNPDRPLLEDLDFLPWPLREGLPMHQYHDAPGGIPVPSVQMWSSRGCPYQCLFCSWPQLMYQSNRYRIRNIVQVVDEMEYLVREKGFKSVYFDDDTMNIGKMRMMEFAEEIKRRKLNIPWAMMARADLMDETILEQLRSAGLSAVKYGVESANQELLNGIRKNMDLCKVERMVRFTKSLGVKTHLTFSFGLPGESWETIKKTVDFAKDLDPDSLQFSITTAFPGTSYFEALEQKGHVVSRDLTDYDGNFTSMLRTENLSAEDLEKAKRYADKTWQAHVWQTRGAGFGLGSYARKFLRHMLSHGAIHALRQSKAFVGSRLRLPHVKLDIRLRMPSFLATLTDRLRLPQLWQPGTFPKIKRKSLTLLGVYEGAHAFKGPDCVQIDLTSNCNNNCVSCWCNSPLLRDRIYKGAKKYKTLPVGLVKTLIADLAGMGTRELYFSGGGEPFMHPEVLSVLEWAKAHQMHCCVNTNFTLVDSMVARQLVDLGLDALTVSVWAATPETYVRTHPNKDGAAFFRIKDTLKLLNSLKKDGKPYIKIYNVISNLNYQELEQMVAFAEETGSEAVEFTVVDTIPGATDQLVLNRAQREEILKQCERIKGRTGKVQVLGLLQFMRRLADTGADQAQYDSGILGRNACYVGWVFSRIMSDGDVNFCLKAHRIPVGNIYKDSFRDIWNSREQKIFRQKAVRQDPKDPFFQGIGNDENCRMGCYKSCDNLGHNDQVLELTAALSPLGIKVVQKAAQAVMWYRKIKRSDR